MNAKQEAGLNMRRSVVGHCDAHPDITSTLPAFLTKTSELKHFINRIVEISGSQEAAITGFASGKAVSKKELCETAVAVARPVHTYARDTGNEPLRAEIDYSYSDLFRKRDDQVAQHCSIILDRAAGHLAALDDYGVTQAKLDDLQAAIESYTAHIETPRAARARRTTDTDNLAELFTDSYETLTEMDDLVINFESDFPDFVKTYRNLRKVDDPKTSSKGNGENDPENPTA